MVINDLNSITSSYSLCNPRNWLPRNDNRSLCHRKLYRPRNSSRASNCSNRQPRSVVLENKTVALYNMISSFVELGKRLYISLPLRGDEKLLRITFDRNRTCKNLKQSSLIYRAAVLKSLKYVYWKISLLISHLKE